MASLILDGNVAGPYPGLVTPSTSHLATIRKSVLSRFRSDPVPTEAASVDRSKSDGKRRPSKADTGAKTKAKKLSRSRSKEVSVKFFDFDGDIRDL